MFNRAYVGSLLKCCVLVLLLLSPLAISAARSQTATDRPADQAIVSLSFRDADVREALATLFKRVQARSVVDDSVLGIVTLQVKDQPFSVALRSLCKSASTPLTYTIENGVYHIRSRGGFGDYDRRTERIPLRYVKADDALKRLQSIPQSSLGVISEVTLRKLEMELSEAKVAERTLAIISGQASAELRQARARVQALQSILAEERESVIPIWVWGNGKDNSIIVTGTPDQLQRVRFVLRKMESIPRRSMP